MPAAPPPPDHLEAVFPTSGVDRAGEFGVQRANTTPAAANVRGIDPLLERLRGGSRHGLVKHPAEQIPEGAVLIQHLNTVVDPRADLLLSTFEDYHTDFVPDPSTNNFPDGSPAGSVPSGQGSRNPALRVIPPEGSGAQPTRTRPDAGARRLALTASAGTAAAGQTVLLTATLKDAATNLTVSGATVTLATQPAGRDGAGLAVTTNGSGQGTFSVSEAGFTGAVRYLAAHQYAAGTPPRTRVVRGSATVTWRSAYTLTLDSPDGTALDADGSGHDLVATLTVTATGAAVPNRRVRLTTDPAGRAGDRARGWTDGSGRAVFAVSDFADESVAYAADLPAQPAVAAAPVTITWGAGTLVAYAAGAASSTGPTSAGTVAIAGVTFEAAEGASSYGMAFSTPDLTYSDFTTPLGSGVRIVCDTNTGMPSPGPGTPDVQAGTFAPGTATATAEGAGDAGSGFLMIADVQLVRVHRRGRPVAAELVYDGAGGWDSGGLVFTPPAGDPLADGVAVGEWAALSVAYQGAGAYLARVLSRTGTTITLDPSGAIGSPPGDSPNNAQLRLGCWECRTAAGDYILDDRLRPDGDPQPPYGGTDSVDYTIP